MTKASVFNANELLCIICRSGWAHTVESFPKASKPLCAVTRQRGGLPGYGALKAKAGIKFA
ncbi:MAG: hypothetical protein DM484_22100 [Candidatus Methylumidiphilus alinenensis]|uniref:Uncharacterized protein n=1 Tax=Candidatus Methylumidiphilus alinenensis TaxID=2202197 RepID=A0A2W4QUL8_9GAMM|nr:MAG: hypothetical protein DM484_22100 [Candidatus Methylumidiphilus alinenensis]